MYEKYVAPLIDNKNLGGFKLEMKDNVGEDTATGVFIALKSYALKGENTGKEKIIAKGIMSWITGDDKKSEARRQQNG